MGLSRSKGEYNPNRQPDDYKRQSPQRSWNAGFWLQQNSRHILPSFYWEKCEIRVDFKDQSISYPETEGFKVNDRTTCNFDHPENFVVLECVCRLLEKGYRPEHIELEKRWNLGHDPKGGKADICIYNKDGKDMLLIIECKTFGTEHNKALKELKEDGGQLFPIGSRNALPNGYPYTRLIFKKAMSFMKTRLFIVLTMTKSVN